MWIALSVVPARATEPYNVIVPTGVPATDTINLITAVASCASPKTVFLGEGTFKIVLTINMPAGCTVSGPVTGSPTASSAGTQNTVVDCSGLANTVPCFGLNTSAVITGFTIIGNGSTPLSNTNCADEESSTGGVVITHMIFRNCGAGINYGNPSGCCAQNMRVVDVTFLNNGYGMYTHDNATDAYFSDLTVISPTTAGIYGGGFSNAWNRITVTGVPHGAIGLDMSGGSGGPVTDVSVDGGTCIKIGAYDFGGIRCAGDGGTNEYCVDFPGSTNLVQMVGIVCSGGYNGSGSGIIAETGSGGCSSNCNLDITWNGTDPLYNNTQAEADMDYVRYTHPVGYAPITLTGSAFAVPDFQNGYNKTFALTSACPCTLPFPTILADGTGGYFAFTQDSTGGRTVTWGTFYQNTAQPLSTANKTTWFPWVVRTDLNAIVLGPSFHN